MNIRGGLNRTFPAALLLLLACTTRSETGKPGPLGKAYNAADYYKNLAGETSTMPQAYRKNLEAIKKAVSSQASQAKHRKVVRISDGDIRTTVVVSWETLPVGQNHLVMTAMLEAQEYSEGTSCSAGDFQRQESTTPYFDMVSVELNCSRSEGSKSHVISRRFIWNGAKNVNEPLVPNGQLNVSDAEISD